MKLNANSVKPGHVITHQNRLWRVVRTQHTMPGKGGAFIQMELKELKSGTKLNERFRSSENVEKAHLDTKDYQYLYADGEMLTLMDAETYEQIHINKGLMGEQAIYLQDGMALTVESHDGSPVAVALPEHVVLTVTESEPVVKGQTAASSNKPALLENGLRVMVPTFIGVGDKVVIKTEDDTYLERAK